MKERLYTRSHAEGLLRTLDLEGSPFTAEEHSLLTSQEYAQHFTSKEVLVSWYSVNNISKFQAVRWLADRIRERNYHSVLSLGSGECVLEHWLKEELGDSVMVVASDFDSYLMTKATELFPELTVTYFDFFRDNLHELFQKLQQTPEVVVFWGSSYVMDDVQFVRLFQAAKNAGVKQVVDFAVGYIPARQIPNLLWERLKSRLKYLFKHKSGFRGKFHGYSRTRDELRRLYARAGWYVAEETTVDGYAYVARCERTGQKS